MLLCGSSPLNEGQGTLLVGELSAFCPSIKKTDKEKNMGHWLKSSLHIALVVVILFFVARSVPAVGSILGLPTSQ